MNHYYVYSFNAGRYFYERTCGTETSAQWWCDRLGKRSVYLINHIIKDAFY